MIPEVHDPRQRVREVLEANGFGWEEAKCRAIITSRVAMGLGSRDSEIDNLLGQYKFRKLLFWLTDKMSAGPFTTDSLRQNTGLNEQALREYLDILNFHRLVNHIGDTWQMAPEVGAATFGPTLERYVAQKFNGDLHWFAASGVCLEDFAYNDFDVVAVRGQSIVVVECKLTDPDHVEDSHIEAFFERHEFLIPDFSLLLIDTDKPVGALAERLTDYVLRRTGQSGQLVPPKELGSRASAFSVIQFIYVASANAKKTDGLLRSLQLCLRHYHSHRRVAVWG